MQNDESNTITQRKRNREKDEGLEVINRFNLNLYEEKVGMIWKSDFEIIQIDYNLTRFVKIRSKLPPKG